jgi:hypothetical protein
MNSFDQIQLEQEAREIIEGYKKKYSTDELNRLDEIEDIYGAKNPGEITFWRQIWDEFNIDYQHGIPKAYLPKAAMGALGLTKNKADDAVDIGQEFDLLIEDKVWEAIASILNISTQTKMKLSSD